MADQWDEFADAWDEFDDAPSGTPAGGRRGRGRPDAAVAAQGERRERESVSQRHMAAAMGQANAAGGVLDFVANTAVNAPADILNSGANLLAAGIGRPLNAFGVENTFEQDARGNGFGRVPLLTQAGRDTEAKVSGMLPEWMQNMDPVVGDFANVTGAAAGGRLLGMPATTAARQTLKESARHSYAGSEANRPQLLARTMGLEVSPRELQHARPTLDVPTSAKVAEGLAGDVGRESRSLANTPQLNKIAGRALGQGDTDVLTPSVIQKAKAPYLQVLDEGAAVPDLPATPDYAAALQNIGTGRNLNPEAVPLIRQRAGQFTEPGTSRERVESIKALREESRITMQGEGRKSARDRHYALGLREIADSLEDELGRRAEAAGNASYQGRLQQERRAYAKAATVEDALVADNLDPRVLKQLADDGVRLDGDLAALAYVAERLPQSITPSPKTPPAGTGVDSSAAGLGGMLTRGFQNTTRRFGGNALLSRFHGQLDDMAQGMTPQMLLPDAYRPPPNPWPMKPNDGPQPGPQPPQAPPGMFADEIPAPRAPAMPEAGRPEAAGPSFNALLAEQMAGDLQLEGALPPVPAPRAVGQRPLDTVDFDRGAPPEAPQPPRGPYSQDEWRISDALQLEGPPEPFAQLGIPRARFGPDDEFPGGAAPAAPALPQGPAPGGGGANVVGEDVLFDMQMLRDAGLDPRTVLTDPARAAETVADMLRGPQRITPLDSPDSPFFVSPAEQAARQERWGYDAPTGGVSDMLTLQRNVPEGADPFTPVNEARSLAMFERGTPEAAEGPMYGPTQGVREFPRSDFLDVGDVEGLRAFVEANPDMTIDQLLAMLSRRPDRPQGVTFTRPPELSGTPREYHRFADDLVPPGP